ncbi:hypothetical protein DMENIID0001_005100 [Sergentomyia squamirostris]
MLYQSTAANLTFRLLPGFLKKNHRQSLSVVPKPGIMDENGFFTGTDLNGTFEVGKKVSSAKLSQYVTN